MLIGQVSTRLTTPVNVSYLMLVVGVASLITLTKFITPISVLYSSNPKEKVIIKD